MNALKQSFQGLILGTAVGDSLGLPREELSKKRAQRMYGDELKQRLIAIPFTKIGLGMVSDDTDHTLFVAQSLIKHHDNVDQFQSRLGGCFKGWFFSLPAGVGLATLKSMLKMLIGFPAKKAGIYSAGNGAAMRAAPIGAFFYNQPEKISEFIHASTVITHTDPKAEIGARAVAYVAALSVKRAIENNAEKLSISDFIIVLQQAMLDQTEENIQANDDWASLIQQIQRALLASDSLEQFAKSLGQGKGVSGYVYHTVPVVMYAWFLYEHDDFGFENALTEVINLGGDADTTGAIIGALMGGLKGHQAIPNAWIEGIFEWGRCTRVMNKIALNLYHVQQSSQTASPVSYGWPALIVRAPFYMLIILIHGFRRLLPPY